MYTIVETRSTNKETRTLKELLPLLLKRRLFTKFQHVRYFLFFLLFNLFFIIIKFNYLIEFSLNITYIIIIIEYYSFNSLFLIFYTN
jgi:hypothetical protein